jgi:cold shock protein
VTLSGFSVSILRGVIASLFFIFLFLLQLPKKVVSLRRPSGHNNFFIIKINSKMKTGTVKFFNVTKGFGFIVENGSNQEVFVHSTGLVDQIKEGDTVSYDVADGKKGLNAVSVKQA